MKPETRRLRCWFLSESSSKKLGLMRTIVHTSTINLLAKCPTSDQGNPYTYRRSHAPTHSHHTLAASLLAGVHVRGCPIFLRLFIKPHGPPTGVNPWTEHRPRLRWF